MIRMTRNRYFANRYLRLNKWLPCIYNGFWIEHKNEFWNRFTGSFNCCWYRVIAIDWYIQLSVSWIVRGIGLESSKLHLRKEIFFLARNRFY
ncbi:hypothetical protein M0R19_05415 [Candidatus Pacearchaeota archaeon]|jgi:hypothetical protein|nr:hypothetical protein [Candidatus Pacearchaeota archaeon]